MKRVVNVAELAKDDWSFVESHYRGPRVQWHYYSASPRNAIERAVRRPKIARVRAISQALSVIRQGDLVISHLPRMTFYLGTALHALSIKSPHVAFAFNFTAIPARPLRNLMGKQFRRISTFVVFSNFEKELYHSAFGIPKEKFQFLHWAFDDCPIDDEFRVDVGNQPYACAVGGEARDFGTLIEAFRRMPERRLVVVTRPNALAGIAIPPNIIVLHNLPVGQFWSVVKRAELSVLLLNDSESVCGHITAVGCMRLGTPLIASQTAGLRDYLTDNVTAATVPVGDVDAVITAVQQLWEAPETQLALADGGKRFVAEHCDPRFWAEFVEQQLQCHSKSQDG